MGRDGQGPGSAGGGHDVHSGALQGWLHPRMMHDALCMLTSSAALLPEGLVFDLLACRCTVSCCAW